ncbi:helix-turn-helix domain-containing protein [Frankia sp. Cas8]|uniref:helix-turn-helix domain-containing protein n=1 Tax=unclassified Frankia TaxID=2632575 RepID=UPI003A0FEFA3
MRSGHTSPFFAELLKTLRTEPGWSPNTLADTIDSDDHQVSRQENGRIIPRLATVVRFTAILTISLDDRVIEAATSRPPPSPTTPHITPAYRLLAATARTPHDRPPHRR